VNLFFAFLLLLAIYSVRINPSEHWMFAFVGMAFPFLFAISLLFVIAWLVFRKWFFVISLVCILAGWRNAGKYLQIRFRRLSAEVSATSLKLLTYNVRLFNYYEWESDNDVKDEIMTFVMEKDPDVVCFQEFVTVSGTRFDLRELKKQMTNLPYEHVLYTSVVPGRINFGLVTFSRYPIIGRGEIDFRESLNGSIYSDIVFAGDTLRIFNCHLQSFRLDSNYRNVVDSLIFNYSDRQLDEIRDISLRMRDAFVHRANQVDNLSAVAGTSPYPVIICGDFNDTPVSYTYKRLSEGMKDAFVESGSGFGTTFRGLFPYMRIDYVLFDDVFQLHEMQIDKVEWSDHYPIVTEFSIASEKDQ
jgi:endonuclease/exonuclease/phosphatase family metal-dependent hydrolase